MLMESGLPMFSGAGGFNADANSALKKPSDMSAFERGFETAKGKQDAVIQSGNPGTVDMEAAR